MERKWMGCDNDLVTAIRNELDRLFPTEDLYIKIGWSTYFNPCLFVHVGDCNNLFCSPSDAVAWLKRKEILFRKFR